MQQSHESSPSNSLTQKQLLHHAILSNQPKQVQEILDANPELLNEKLTCIEETPLMVSVRHERLIITNIILSKNPNLELQTVNEHTVGMIARNKDQAMQDMLLAGTSTKEELKLPHRAAKAQKLLDDELYLAMQTDNLNMARWLIRNGASLMNKSNNQKLLQTEVTKSAFDKIKAKEIKARENSNKSSFMTEKEIVLNKQLERLHIAMQHLDVAMQRDEHENVSLYLEEVHSLFV